MDTSAGGRSRSRSRPPPRSASSVPALPPFAVERPRLTRVLDVAGRQPLTVVVAPPGYGKTVLLAQWLRSRRRGRVRWITLGPEHDDVAVLRDALTQALAPSRGASAGGGLATVARAPRRAVPRSRASLVEAIEHASPATLVLDDLQQLSNPSALALVADVLHHAPRSLRIVTATRVDPPLHLYRLRDHGVSFQLRQEDLAFSCAEAAELVRRLVRVELPEAQVRALVERTEGWAAGLQLAALALPARRDIEHFVTDFIDDERAVADYLTEQVLGDLPPHLLDFLVSTCELDRMSGPLCDHLRGRSDSRSILEELERRSMFVTALDDERSWFRYHRLFRAYLRTHLAEAGTSSRAEVLCRAAEWHRVLGDVDTAVGYLAAAGRWEEVLELASDAGVAMVGHGGASAVAGWFGMVPDSARHRRRVSVAIDQATALFSCGRLLEVQPVLDGVAAAASDAERAVLDLLDAWRALQLGRLDRALCGTDRAVAAASRLDDRDEVPTALGLLEGAADVARAATIVRGAALVHLDRFPEARAALGSSLDGLHGRWRLLSLGSLALLEAWSGQLDRAEECARQVLRLAEQLGREVDPAVVDATLALAVVTRSRGHLDAARRLLQHASSAVRPGDGTLRPAGIVDEQALLALAEGDPAAGLAALAARPSGRARGVGGPVIGRSATVEAEVSLANGDLERAARALSDTPPEAPDVVSARVRLELARGDRAAARTVVGDWPEATAREEPLEHLLATAVVEHLDGDERVAERHIDEVVHLAELDGNVGIFNWHEARSFVRSRYRTTPTPFLRAVVEQPVPSGSPAEVEELVDQLTEREHLVLQLLPTRMANSEMAESMGISLNTVKTHLKHVYRKLGVEHRRDAITTAERLGLL